MKCEKCKEKEATFYYSCSINGQTTEKHLCADCAREEGFGETLDYRPRDMFADVEAMFQNFFAPHRSLLSSFGSFGHPLRAMMAPAVPRMNIVIGEPDVQERAETSESKIPVDAGEEVKARRELAALKEQLRAAVDAEDFETAITLRDEIRRREG